MPTSESAIEERLDRIIELLEQRDPIQDKLDEIIGILKLSIDPVEDRVTPAAAKHRARAVRRP